MDNLYLAYLLIAAGILFVLLEFVLPGGIMGVLGLGGVITGLAILFSNSPTQGLVTLIALFIIVPILGPILLHYWPKTRWGKQFVLSGPEEDASMAQMPVHLELEQLRGRYGKTLSALRPAGITEFDGKRIDTLSEGVLIEAGQWVRCVDVREGRVFVRPVDKPPDLGDIDPDDLRSNDER